MITKLVTDEAQKCKECEEIEGELDMAITGHEEEEGEMQAQINDLEERIKRWESDRTIPDLLSPAVAALEVNDGKLMDAYNWLKRHGRGLSQDEGLTILASERLTKIKLGPYLRCEVSA